MSKKLKQKFKCFGPLRGWCGNNHKTLKDAEFCQETYSPMCEEMGIENDRVISEEWSL